MTSTGRQRAIVACLIAVTAAISYGPTIHDYFTQDDFGVVSLLSSKPVFYFPRWFVAPWTENIWGYVPDEIRPFPALSYQVAGAFGPASPEPNHLFNIALHAFNALLVFWIAQAAAGLGVVAATVAALVFVVLPIEAESVAWVTGRVDSLPACFYFASFLLYVQSGIDHRRTPYVWSLVLFFAALFSKQNTIVMAPALILYDWAVAKKKAAVSWEWLRPYVPYLLLTAGFLLLRYVLFHEVARESTLSARRFSEFVSDTSRHLARLVFGGPGLRHWTLGDTGIILLAAGMLVVGAIRLGTARVASLWRPAVYFGLIWVVLGVAPIVVSGYYSPRHMYLASLGWAVAVGLAADVCWRVEPARYARTIAIAGAAALVVAYGVQLRGVVREWNLFGDISRAAVTDVEHEAMQDPAGTLILMGVPTRSWAFAVPHALRPPFTRTDLTSRVLVVSDSSLHCCDAAQWNDYTRRLLRSWQARSDHPPIVALYWDPRTGRLSRVSDKDDPQLRTLVTLLLETDSRETLDSAIRGILNNFVAVR